VVFLVCVELSNVVRSQGISIKHGTVLSLGGSSLTVPGNWTDNGSFAANSGSVYFIGNSGDQTIARPSGETFTHLTVNKGSGSVQLSSNITVNGILTVISGDLAMSGKTITLGSSALMQETAGNTIKGNGAVSGTLNLNAPASVNPFGLGATITSAANLGITSIVRGHAVQSGGGESSIKRYFDITPSVNTGLNATLQFSYDESELNGKSEGDLSLYRSTDAGVTWQIAGGTVNASENTVTLSGIDGFSRWTLAGSNSPLPVLISSFIVSTHRLNAELRWTTATEVNNYGFEIEKSSNTKISNFQNSSWEKIGFVEGNGTSNTAHEYTYSDRSLSAGKYSYRLKQIDRDGKFGYSMVTDVTVGSAPLTFELAQNHPNPFNPSTNIEFTVPVTGKATLKVYNVVGQEVATLFDGIAEAGIFHQSVFNASQLSSGIYLVRLVSEGKMQVRKMMLMK
jgi:hypothetical protein